MPTPSARVSKILRMLGLCMLIIPSSASAQWLSIERQLLGEVLVVGGFTESDLKSFLAEAPAAGLPQRLFNSDPLEGTDALLRFHRRQNTGLGTLLRTTLEFAYGDRLAPTPEPRRADTWPTRVPPPLHASLSALVDAVADAQSEVRGSLKRLLPEERRLLIEGLPLEALGNENVKIDFIKQLQTSKPRLAEAIQKVNFEGIRKAAAQLAARIDRQLPVLRERARASTWRGQLKFALGGVNLEIGGVGPNRYAQRDTHLCVDLGGDDAYVGRYGAAAGYTSVLIDLGGNDTVSGPDLNYGAAILGIGLVVNLGGDDRVTTSSLSIGSGLLGVGAYWKEGGQDRLVSGSLSQGFGGRGVGVYFDSSGDDRLEVRSRGQGAGQDSGVGVFGDLAGDDDYLTTGGEASPIASGVRYSRAQGFGERDGIGLFSDFSGSDVVRASAMSQGSARQGGLGSLFDGGGSDVRRCSGQGQSFANQGFASFFDLEGDDTNLLEGSGGHAEARGPGFAIVLDRDGNDQWIGSQSHPGSAQGGGLSIFLDTNGVDTYAGACGQVGGDGLSLALFGDAAGQDVYLKAGGNDEALLDAIGGVFLDRALVAPDQEEILAVPPPPVRGLTQPEIEQRWREFLSPTMGRGSALSKLLEAGPAAIDFALDKTEQEIPTESCVAVARVLGDTVRDVLIARLSGPGAQKVLRVAAGAQIPLGKDLVAPLKNPEQRLAALSVAVAVASPEAVAELVEIAKSPDQTTMLLALKALAIAKNPIAFAAGVPYLDSPDLRVRNAAQRVVSLSESDALGILRGKLNQASGDGVVRGLELAAQISGSGASEIAAAYLKSAEPRVRIAALRAVSGRVPRDAREQVLRLQSDPDPLVRAIALRLDLGR